MRAHDVASLQDLVLEPGTKCRHRYRARYQASSFEIELIVF